MAQTTTAYNFCDAVIELDDDVGVLQDISGSSNEVQMDFKKNIGQSKVFANDYPIRIECGKDASFALKVLTTSATDEAKDLLEQWYHNGSGARTLRVSEPDGTAGSKRYTVEVLLENYAFTASGEQAGPGMIDANLLPTGAVTFATI